MCVHVWERERERERSGLECTLCVCIWVHIYSPLGKSRVNMGWKDGERACKGNKQQHKMNEGQKMSTALKATHSVLRCICVLLQHQRHSLTSFHFTLGIPALWSVYMLCDKSRHCLIHTYRLKHGIRNRINIKNTLLAYHSKTQRHRAAWSGKVKKVQIYANVLWHDTQEISILEKANCNLVTQVHVNALNQYFNKTNNAWQHIAQEINLF